MPSTHLSDLEVLGDLVADPLAVQRQLQEIAKESVGYANAYADISYDKKSKQLTYKPMRRGDFLLNASTITVSYDFHAARWRSEFIRRCAIQRFVEQACDISAVFEKIYRTELIQKMEIDLVERYASGCVELPCISLLDFPKFIYADFVNHLADLAAEQSFTIGIP